jgi:endoglucanase
MTLPATAFPLAVSGAKIIGADSNPVRLCGVNWGGAHQNGLLPYGLDRLPRSQIISRIIGWGFNHVRFPFALGTFVNSNGTLKTGLADPAGLTANPDLESLTPWGVYQQLVADMTAAGLYVITNQHLLFQGWCCSSADGNGLWYNGSWPSSTYTAVWNMVATAFAGNPMVGYDLHNEPRPATVNGTVLTPTWGDNVWATDMQRIYNYTAGQIRAIDPDALLFCEGLNYAGDLTKAGAYPVTGPGIVYSLHDYSWFHPGGQSLTDYYNQMDAAGGYLVLQGKAPLWIGEFGISTDQSTAGLNTGWFPQFLSYAQARVLHTCWWELNATAVLGIQPVTNITEASPGQRESYGLMSGQDWQGSQADVIAMIEPLMS